jgi:hypothetical protein
MKSITNFIVLIIGSIFLLFYCESCTSKKEKIRQQEIKVKQLEIEKGKEAEKLEEQKDQEFNDSIILSISKKNPLAVNLDTIEYKLTYFFQDLLEKSSNLVFIKEAWIKDLEKYKDYYLISVYTYSPEMYGKFRVNSALSGQLLKKIKSDDTYEKLCLVVKVNTLVPINNELVAQIEKFSFTPEDNTVNESDVSDYFHLEFNSSFNPFYLVTGDLLEIAILK